MLEFEEIYRSALEKWGREGQFDQAVEECAELITAIKHYRRGKIDEDHLMDELADVVLMVGQLVYMLGREGVETVVERKINKLRNLLEEG